MHLFQITVLALVLLCAQARPGHQQQGQQHEDSWGMRNQNDQPHQQGARGKSSGGWNDNQHEGRMQGSRQNGEDNRKYRTNLYNDDDVYGYDASYPNGQALYVNYRNTDARARRGPEFARSNSISSRRSGGNGNSADQQQRSSNHQVGQSHENQW